MVSEVAEGNRKARPPKWEQDLGLKLAMRRVFWGMNYATRLNLILALPGPRRAAAELSDLDCVGFSVGGDFSVRLLIADCKSGGRTSVASRLFWLAGVRDFFGADRAYEVVVRDIPAGVREQASRLGVDLLGDSDREVLENVNGQMAPAAPFFDIQGAVRLQDYERGLDKRLNRLVQFRDHEYWHLPPERRLQRLIAAIREAGPVLDVHQRAHVVLVVDLLFLLTLSLLGACRSVSAVSLADPRQALLSYLLGGNEQTRSREESLRVLVSALESLSDRGVEIPDDILAAASVEPPYFNDLAEVVTRLLRRPRDAQRLLRYFEWWGQAELALGAPSAEVVLGSPYGEFTRKLASDISRMCFKAANLGREWHGLLTGGALPEAPASGGKSNSSGAPTQLPLGG